MAEADPAWAFVGSSIEGQQFDLKGLNPWEHPWVLLAGQVAHVKDPLYGQPYRFNVYVVAAHGRTVRFAAGEFSNSLYGFYVLR